MSARYFVVGGEYADTTFTRIAEGKAEERHGPYPDYETARREWGRLAMAHVDDAYVRYRIVGEEASEFWVVGGVYASTDFTHTIDGSPEVRIGPFQTYDEAKRAWQEKAWSSVDDAYSRYRIEKR